MHTFAVFHFVNVIWGFLLDHIHFNGVLLFLYVTLYCVNVIWSSWVLLHLSLRMIKKFLDMSSSRLNINLQQWPCMEFSLAQYSAVYVCWTPSDSSSRSTCISCWNACWDIVSWNEFNFCSALVYVISNKQTNQVRNVTWSNLQSIPDNSNLQGK